MVEQERPGESNSPVGAGGPSTEVGTAEPAENLVGVPDGFQRLWTPHRMAYIVGDRPSRDAGSDCPFCAAPDKDDTDGLVVHRGQTCYVVLNLFPYNPGHLLICPYRHVPLYTDLTAEETVEFAALTQTSMSVLTRVSAPGGFNIWMNQGDVAGAGVAAHLHQHVVPRWGGDMNFLPIIGQTKALPTLLEDARQALIAEWPA